jgi:hypothetical protein
VSIQFRTSRGEVSERDPLKSDPVDALFVFAERDYAPKEPILGYGFPPKSVRTSERQRTVAEFNLSRKEVIQELIDSDEEQ